MKKTKTIIGAILLSLALTSCTNNFSEGERVGIITKFSNQGMFWKSWEGDLKTAPNIGNGGMVGQYEDFLFSVDNDNTISCSTNPDSINKFMKEGVAVVLIYQQVKGYNWFHNRGKTDSFIKEVKRAK